MSHKRKAEEYRHMSKLWDQTKQWYGRGCWKGDDGRYRKYYRHKSQKKPLREMGNRYFRRTMKKVNEIGDAELYYRGLYKKAFDLWWKLL